MAQQLESGLDIEQVAAFLGAESDVVDVTVDGPVLGFRIAGGRPMIVDVTGEQAFLSSSLSDGAATNQPGLKRAAASVTEQPAVAQTVSALLSAPSGKSSGGNMAQRRALVLSPFRYEENEFRYLVSTPVPLPFDVKEGQTLNMDFWIPLPDLGEDHFLAAPKVNERDAPEMGSEWTLSSRATLSRTDDVTITTASVVFELDPDDNPESTFHYFYVKSGSVRIQREYEDALGCSFSVDYTIDIPAGAANNYLKFEVSGQNVMLEGFGSVASETIQTTGDCGDSASVRVGGVYFVAEDAQVSGGSVQGGYNDGSNVPTIIEWSLARTK